MELEIKDLSKNYGKINALKGVSLSLSAGVYGLLGPNGAGKSTLIQIITGNLRATNGEVFYNGRNVNADEKSYKKVLGYVPQSQGIYDSFPAKKFLEYMAVLKAIEKNEIHKEVERVLEVVGLSHVQNRKLGGFSGGMRQRILVAQALLGDPELIILDEPTAGLDPKERIKIRNFISRLAENKIILLATHVVSDVESIAKEIILLGEGEIKQQGMPRELCGSLEGMVFSCTLHPQDFEWLEKKFVVSNVQEMPEGNLKVRIIGDETDVKELEKKQIQAESVFPNLQEVYLYTFESR